MLWGVTLTAETEKTGQNEDDQVDEDVRGEEREEERTSLVGTQGFQPLSPASNSLIQVIKSLTRVKDAEEIRPTEQYPNAKWTRGAPTPEEVTLLVLSYDDYMDQIAA